MTKVSFGKKNVFFKFSQTLLKTKKHIMEKMMSYCLILPSRVVVAVVDEANLCVYSRARA